MKKLVVLSCLLSLSVGANAYLQTCFYGKDCVNGQIVKVCDTKCKAKKAVLKARKEAFARRHAAAAAARREHHQREAAALAAKKAQQERDAATLAAIGKVKQIDDEISVVLSNDILFEYNRVDLSKKSQKTLNQAVELLNQLPKRSLVIQGHTDSIGPKEYNMELSEKRAKAVYDYMMEKGLKIKKVSYKGYGANKPIADNSTKEGRTVNRRVEFRIK